MEVEDEEPWMTSDKTPPDEYRENVWRHDGKEFSGFTHSMRGHELYEELSYPGGTVGEEVVMARLKALPKEELVDFCLYRYDYEYCYQFTYNTMLSESISMGYLQLVSFIIETVRDAKPPGFFREWLNTMHEGHIGAGADGTMYSPLGVCLQGCEAKVAPILFVLLDAGCSLSQHICYDEKAMSLFSFAACEGNTYAQEMVKELKKVLAAWRHCRAAVFALLLSARHSTTWDSRLMRLLCKEYVWPTRGDIESWQRNAASVVKEAQKEKKRVEKERKRVIREKKKAECDAIKAGKAGVTCEHHIRIDE